LTFWALNARAYSIPCGPRTLILTELSEKHGEIVIFRGVFEGSIFEVFWSPDASNNWTAAVTRPDMTMCLIAMGYGGALLPGTAQLQDKIKALRLRFEKGAWKID
jgi:hypothetical protein